MPDLRAGEQWALLWGDGENLAPIAMAVRAFVMFFVVLAFLRLGGARIFGNKSALDAVVVIMLGAIAARGIVGASPFGSCVVACGVIVASHFVVAKIQSRSAWVGRILCGSPVVLYRRPHVLHENLAKALVSEADLMQSARLETGQPTLEGVDEAVMERNGRISFVRKG